MDSYYEDGPLACGHVLSLCEIKTAFWAILPGTTGGTACLDCALVTELCGGTADRIPTNEQVLHQLDWEMAGIGVD